MNVGDLMTEPVVTVKPDIDLGIDRLPVVDGGQLVGIVTRSDLVRAFTRSDDAIAREIREQVIVGSVGA